MRIGLYLLLASTFMVGAQETQEQCIKRVEKEAKDCKGEINCALKNIAELRKCFDLEEESNEED